MTASAWRGGAEGVAIRFAVGQCSLGAVLVAATERGVCAIEFGDDPDELVRGLQDRFAKARLIGGDEGFERLVAEVVGAVEDPRKATNLPLDVRGTAFQERVWQALRTIPSGQTAPYAEIAAAIGAPRRSGRWRRPAAPIPLRWPFPATVWSGPTAPRRLSLGRGAEGSAARQGGARDGRSCRTSLSARRRVRPRPPNRCARLAGARGRSRPVRRRKDDGDPDPGGMRRDRRPLRRRFPVSVAGGDGAAWLRQRRIPILRLPAAPTDRSAPDGALSAAGADRQPLAPVARDGAAICRRTTRRSSPAATQRVR